MNLPDVYFYGSRNSSFVVFIAEHQDHYSTKPYSFIKSLPTRVMTFNWCPTYSSTFSRSISPLLPQKDIVQEGQMAAVPVPLNLANLPKVGNLPNVRIPTYARAPAGAPTIVHISVGGFHRAHQAVYLDDLLQSNAGGERWRLVGVGLLPFDIPARDAMKAQDCLYTLIERDQKGDSARVIASISEYLYAPEQGTNVMEVMADASCRIVSMTITEGGYFIHEGTGDLNVEHPDIQHDLANPAAPRSSFGYILAALRKRKANGLQPFTVLSCDNMQSNGDVAKKMISAFAKLADPELALWLEKNNAAFPNCMVDRITPATTDVHRKLVAEKFGILDQWPVTCESFRQWVVEDHFPLGRPAWEKAGAQMTPDVLPYELMKIRLLNASHQALCYTGMLIGHRYAPEAMADANISKLLRRMMDEEVTPYLKPVPGVNLEDYKSTVIERFANPAVNDQLLRIGTEGSARIAKFVLPCVRDSLVAGGKVKFLSFTVASWIYYLGQTKDETGQLLGFIDPMLARVQAAAVAGKDDAKALLEFKEIFGADLAGNAKFAGQVDEILKEFYASGPSGALKKYVNSA
ncbi:Mannitol 2-dehydrogenase [Hypsibius exemplaris]|uniref:mannitol 2-dehydrogenase n=1 Tax=Hypsibius exemplaris TaxID=2072580 RepID=A0A9X6RN88_HYPEX|nr:Mannitol 2-dehydrogenase [Hypsibius exemplaris]